MNPKGENTKIVDLNLTVFNLNYVNLNLAAFNLYKSSFIHKILIFQLTDEDMIETWFVMV